MFDLIMIEDYYYNKKIENDKRKENLYINDKNLILFYLSTTTCFAMTLLIIKF